MKEYDCIECEDTGFYFTIKPVRYCNCAKGRELEEKNKAIESIRIKRNKNKRGKR